MRTLLLMAALALLVWRVCDPSADIPGKIIEGVGRVVAVGAKAYYDELRK